MGDFQHLPGFWHGNNCFSLSRFIDFFGSWSYKKSMTEHRDRDLTSTEHGPSSQDWARRKSEARSFLWVSYLGSRGPRTWIIFHCSSQAINRDLDQIKYIFKKKRGGEQLEHKLTPIWNASVAGSSFTYYATTLALVIVFGKWLCSDHDKCERTVSYSLYPAKLGNSTIGEVEGPGGYLLHDCLILSILPGFDFSCFWFSNLITKSNRAEQIVWEIRILKKLMQIFP